MTGERPSAETSSLGPMVRMPKTVMPVIAARTTHFRDWGRVDVMIAMSGRLDVQVLEVSDFVARLWCRVHGEKSQPAMPFSPLPLWERVARRVAARRVRGSIRESN